MERAQPRFPRERRRESRSNAEVSGRGITQNHPLRGENSYGEKWELKCSSFRQNKNVFNNAWIKIKRKSMNVITKLLLQASKHPDAWR